MPSTHHKNGYKKEFGDCGIHRTFGPQSQGLVYIGQKFFDVETGEIKIDLSQYDMGGQKRGYASYDNSLNNNGNLAFSENGVCYFEFFNPGKKVYVAGIDTNGNIVDKPHALQSGNN